MSCKPEDGGILKNRHSKSLLKGTKTIGTVQTPHDQSIEHLTGSVPPRTTKNSTNRTPTPKNPPSGNFITR